MYTEELLVHHGCEGKCTERIHTSLVDLFGVFMLTFELEREIIRQMSAFMIPSQKPEGIGIPYLEGPKIQYALTSQQVVSMAYGGKLTSMLK